MRQTPSLPSTLAPDSPVVSLGKHIRWQVILTLIGVLLLLTLLSYSTYTAVTVLAPDYGGVYREGVAGNPRYLNPLRCQASDIDQDLCTLLYRGLTRIDEHGLAVPDLAESWTVTNGTIYTFQLKDEQYWSDGRPVTADDVLFTMGILQDPEVYRQSDILGMADLARLWRDVTLEKIDDRTVRFSRSEPFTPFLDGTAVGLLPAHIWGDVPVYQLASEPLNGIPVSNGAMYVVSMMGDAIYLEPNPFYAGPKPYISALELRFYPDHPSLFAAYTTGDIDGISRILPSDMPAANARNDLQIFSSVQPGNLQLIFNLRNPDLPFFQDQRVRQALYYALNRDRLIEEIAEGQGIIAHSLLLPAHWAYNNDVPIYEFKPDEARRLLDEAGWIDTDGDGVRDKEGRPLQFLLSTNDDVTRLALLERIALMWSDIGVRAVPTQVTFQGLLNELLIPRHFDMVLLGWESSGGDPDPYALWHSTQAEGGGQNYSGWSNEEADEMMQNARAITNQEERKELYIRFQTLFAEDVPAILLYHPVYTYGVNERIKNVQIGALNYPSERFSTFADWYIVTRRVPENQAPAAIPLALPQN